MYTSAPDITVDTTVGQVVVPSTATPTPVATATTAPTSRASATPSATPTSPAGSQTPQPPLFGRPLSIYGWGPAGSDVNLVGIGVSGNVIAKEDGFFRFESVYSYSPLYPELCIQATDIDKRVTQPVCIPPIPNGNLIPLEVGPVLLSPTLSLSKNSVTQGDHVYISGYSIPSSNINIYLAKKTSKKLTLISEANAFYLPEYQTQTNEKGYFEVSMPSNTESTYKLYASSKMGSENSGKSNTLTYKVLSKAASFWKLLFELLFRSWISVVILVQVILIVFLSHLISESNKRVQRGTSASRSNKRKGEKLTKMEEIKERYLDLLASKPKDFTKS